MAVVLARKSKLAYAICEVLGLDPKDTRSIEIKLHADSVSLIEVETYLTEDTDTQIAGEIKKCTFKEISSHE